MKNKLKNVLPIALYIIFCFAVNAYAEDMWEVANRIIVDVYNKIAGISTAEGRPKHRLVKTYLDCMGYYKRHRCILGICSSAFVGIGNNRIKLIQKE